MRAFAASGSEASFRRRCCGIKLGTREKENRITIFLAIRMCSETRTFERMPDWRRARVLWQQSPDFHRTLQRRRWPATDPAIPQPEFAGMRSWPANPFDGLLATRKH